MTADVRKLSDDALAAALAIATLRRTQSGCLGVRTELAVIEAERDRRIEVRDLQRTWAAS